jgi:putative methyltransferase
VNDGALEEGHQTAPKANRHPRWVRVNALVTSLKEQLATTFSGYDEADSLARVMAASASTKLYFPDPNIPNLLAFPPKIDLSKSSAYTSGKIIFQDKASCFPAHLLNLNPQDGDVVDGCAAPGNKTTHLAAIVSSFESETTKQRVIAFERDKTRTGTLKKMVKLASAGRIVSVKGGADFLAAAPDAEEFSGVGALVLDPSCTGSGIVGRDDAIRVHLPDQASAPAATVDSKKSKKRKRGDEKNDTSKKSATLTLDLDDSTPEETPEEGKLSDRLIALSTFQFRILTHAMRFPNAHKITYSTCSIHFEENEGVVARALASPAAKEGGWRILERDAQVDGLNIWQKRGLWEDGKLNENIEVKDIQKQEICDACIRCEKGNEDGTMGFFVAAFTRDVNSDVKTAAAGEYNDREDDDEWTGFGDTDQDAAVKPAEKVLPSVSPHSKNKKKKRSNKS